MNVEFEHVEKEGAGNTKVSLNGALINNFPGTLVDIAKKPITLDV